jgi:hypothetical protein
MTLLGDCARTACVDVLTGREVYREVALGVKCGRAFSARPFRLTVRVLLLFD